MEGWGRREHEGNLYTLVLGIPSCRRSARSGQINIVFILIRWNAYTEPAPKGGKRIRKERSQRLRVRDGGGCEVS